MSGIASRAPTAPPLVIKSYPPVSNRLELLDLLVTGRRGTHRETFSQKIQSILNKTPRIGTPTKAGFFTYKMIGTLTVLPYTELMSRLHIQKIYIKAMKSGKNILTVKAALQLETGGKKALQLYTFASTNEIDKAQNWRINELEELISNLKITKNSLPDYEVNEGLQVSGRIYQMDPSFILQEKNIEIVPSGRSKVFKDLKETFRSLVQEQPLPASKKEAFKEVTRVVNLEGSNIKNLESYFEGLSSYCANLEEIDDTHKQGALQAVAERVEETARDLIKKGLSPIYTYWKNQLNLGVYEVSSHGYVTGVLENLFKYRYALDIEIEKNLGLGRADLTVVSRLDGLANKNWNGTPLGFEFKGFTYSPDEALGQMIKQGYLRLTSKTRTRVKKGAGLGVNMNLEQPVASKVIDIKVEPVNFVKTLLNLGDSMIANAGRPVDDPNTQAIHNDVLQKLKEALADVDYSIVRQNGSPDNSNYFKNFILGQAMGFTESDCSTYAIFEKDNPNLSLFFVKENKVVILTIDVAHILSEHETKAAFLQQKGVLLRNSPYFAVTVDVDHQSTPTLGDTASGDFDLDWPNHKDFLFKEIKPLKFIQKNSLAHQEVTNELVDFRNKGFEVIGLESDEQALWQGGLLASGEVQVYTESNHVLGKRADLVLLPSKEEHNVKVVELKYAGSSKEAAGLQSDAVTQVGYLRGNLKSFTDKGVVDLVAMTYDAEKNAFIYNEWPENIEHTSQGQDSPRKSIDSNSPIKRKSPESDSSSDSEKTGSREKDSTSKSVDKGKKSGASILANIFGGIGAALGTILFATGATAFSVLKGAAGNILSGIENIRTNNLLNSDIEITSQELGEIEQFANEIKESSKVSKAKKKTMERYKKKLENLEKKYQERGEQVNKKIQKRIDRKRAEQSRNKRRKLDEAGPSHAKRSVLSPIPEEDELLAEGMVSHDRDNCTSLGIVRETVPNKLFSLCRIQSEKDGDESHESGIERIELDCYLEIDYQNKDSVLVDASLWDLANKTIRYEDEVVFLSLSSLDEDEKRLVLADASRVHYEFVDTHANIFTLPLNETQTCFQVNQTETSTEELEETTLTTPVPPLEIEEKENKVEIANCSRIELTASHNESYVEGDCVINPTLNSIDVVEISPSHDQTCFVKFSNWNLLRSAIEYREANNTLTVTVKDSDAIGIRPFQVDLRNYLHRESNSTSYQLSDRVFEEVISVFTQRNDEILQKITSFHIKTSIPETILNQEGDKASNVLTWYKNSTQAEAGIEVLYGEVVNPAHTIWKETRIRHHGPVFVQVSVNQTIRGFGSKFNDKIWVYDDFMYVYGGEGKDCYVVEPNRSGGIKMTFINNDAEDEIRDYLVLPIPFRALAIGLYHNNSIQFFSTQREFGRKMVLANYCKDANKQHLAVLTNDGCLIGLPSCELLAECTRPQRISAFFTGNATATAEVCNITMEKICDEMTERNHRSPIRKKRTVNERINKKRKTHRIPFMEQSLLRPLGMSYDEQMPRIEAKRATEKSSSVQPRYGVTAYENVPFIKWLSYLFGRRSFVERMNKAERVGSLYERDAQDSSLYWAEKRLKEGMALYGADEED